ncbi:MAG: hypothetical protein WCG22_05500 [Lentisphaerota bacterium]
MHASTYSGTFQSTVHRATIPGLIIAVSLFANDGGKSGIGRYLKEVAAALVAADIAVLLICVVGALWLRFDNGSPGEPFRSIRAELYRHCLTLLLALVCYVIIFSRFRLYGWVRPPCPTWNSGECRSAQRGRRW